MFIYSVRAGTLKLFGFIALAVVLTLGIVFIGTDGAALEAGASGTVDFSGVKTNADRVKFIEQFGIQVDDTPIEEEAFAIPENFDRVILGYNELQKKQGLDLSKYAKKRVTRYTYKVENYDWDGEVYVNLFIWRSRVVGCDISSADPEGFVAPLTLVNRTKLK